jgi:peptidoglycan/LPS O-acetylase OafA/YrhL
MIEFKYRPDIDGLRAVAVLLVLLFHVGLGFPGGFVGVDIFFVISGFLITGLILKEQRAEKFLLSHFWIRRIRRILPASIVVVIATLLAGGLLLTPHDYKDLAESTIYQQLMLSNVYFWQDVGYFKGPAELKPLLHTWSLAVEEQFYLGYPFLLVFLRRWTRAKTLWMLIALALFSFVLSEWGTQNSPSAAFYLLPTRAWELLLGGLICFAPPPTRMSQWQAHAMGGLGVAGIVVSSCFYDATTRFPGSAALLPCVGAALLIYVNSKELNWTGKLLAWKPMVFIGLLSYSLYLWHWPILAYCKYSMPGTDLSVTVGVLVLVASFALAYLSWRFVERPFRQPKEIARVRRSLSVIAGAALLTMFFSIVVYSSSGLPSRFSQQVLACIDDETWNGFSLLVGEEEFFEGGLSRVGDTESAGEPSFFVWGDSHAMMCAEVIDDAGKSAGQPVVVGSTAGTPPVPGLWRGRDPNSRKLRERVNQEILEAVMRPNITDVVLVARWSAYVEGYSDSDLSHEKSDKEWDEFLVVDEASTAVSPEESVAALERGLIKLTKQLQDAGKTVWILKQPPEMHQPIATYLLRSLRFGVPLRIDEVDRDDHFARQGRVNAMIDRLAHQGVNIIDLTDQFFDAEGHAVPILDGRALYRDDDHLSRTGAQRMLGELFSDLIHGRIQPRVPVAVNDQ